MKLGSELLKIMGAEAGTGVEYTVTAGGVYLQNVKRLIAFSAERVVLRGRKGAVEIEGTGLSLGKYESGDVHVRGDILRVTRLP